MTYVANIELGQIVIAVLGLCISGYSLIMSLLDISAIIRSRSNGMNGLIGVVRLRRELFQFSGHTIMLTSTIIVIAIRYSADLTIATPAGWSTLYTRNVSYTLISLLMICNTLFDRFERWLVTEHEPRNRRVTDRKGEDNERTGEDHHTAA